jgi:S1-C subfamily serine protease
LKSNHFAPAITAGIAIFEWGGRMKLTLYGKSAKNLAKVLGIIAGVALLGCIAWTLSGDVILAINGEKITSQTDFYRKLWSLGPAGVDVPLTVYHEGVTFDVVLTSIDRAKLLKTPRLH